MPAIRSHTLGSHRAAVHLPPVRQGSVGAQSRLQALQQRARQSGRRLECIAGTGKSQEKSRNNKKLTGVGTQPQRWMRRGQSCSARSRKRARRRRPRILSLYAWRPASFILVISPLSASSPAQHPGLTKRCPPRSKRHRRGSCDGEVQVLPWPPPPVARAHPTLLWHFTRVLRGSPVRLATHSLRCAISQAGRSFVVRGEGLPPAKQLLTRAPCVSKLSVATLLPYPVGRAASHLPTWNRG